MKKILALLILLSISLTSALSVDIPVPTNYSLVPTVNDSDYWGGRYDEGDLDHSGLNNLGWAAAGHIINANIDMNDYLLEDMSVLVLSGGGYLGDFDGDLDIASNLTPQSTLYYNLGSGALRWLWLYVQNISTDTIDAFSITATDNITAEYFIGDGSYLTGVGADMTNVCFFNETNLNTTIGQNRDVVNIAFKNESTEFTEDFNVSINSDRDFLIRDTRARAAGNNVSQWLDSTGKTMATYSYSSLGDKDLEIRFGDDEHTKIGFPEAGYFGFINDVSEFWLGTTGDPSVYFNYYVGSNEYHGTVTNLQTVYYYANPFHFYGNGIHRRMDVVTPQNTGEFVRLDFGTQTAGLQINGFTNITNNLTVSNLIGLETMILPACAGDVYNGTIARNASNNKLSYCDGIVWQDLY